MKKDYYEILGVAKDATIAQIKKAYRSAALKYHPDRVAADQKKEAEEKFKEVSEAYGVLSDTKKRQLYDQYGHAGIDQNFTQEDIFRNANFNEFGDLGDIFSQIFGGSFGGSFGDAFGGQRRQRGPQRGHDIQYEVNISLEEAHKGIKKSILIPRNELCKKCDGSGAKSSSSVKKCTTCNGSGHVVTSSGFFRMQQTCPQCHGQGQIITEYCSECNGRGHVKHRRKIDVNIPAGVDNSSRLRVRNEGEIDKGGPGDLYLYIHVLPHDVFERNGNDIYIQLPVSFVKAALGSEVSVPTLGGNVSMKIPAGTQSGKVFRLKAKGMPDVHAHGHNHGDQYVKVMLEVPERLTAEQKRLLEEFARVSGEDISNQNDSLGDTIKEKIKKVFK